MAGFLEVQAVEAKAFLPLEQVEFFTVSLNFHLLLSLRTVIYASLENDILFVM